jgi:hypothetical protein
MSLFNGAEAIYLDFVFGSGFPVSFDLGLSTNTLDDTGVTGEPSGGGYARLTITNNATNFPAATTVGGVTSKVNGATFTFPTATGSWGTVRHWFLYDNTSAIYLIHGPLTNPKGIGAGDIFRIPVGYMVITLD